MSVATHIVSLQKKHTALSEKIVELHEQIQPCPFQLQKAKRKKLQVKDTLGRQMAKVKNLLSS